MSGQIQTLATPPPVSVQTLLYNIYLAAASGGSGGASWGSITGTLSAQTDLQTALDAKLPLTGGTLTPAANTTALTLGGSLTGSNAQPALSLNPTWNTTGAPALIYGRVTNTASGASAKLIDLGTVADGSLFSVEKSGYLNLPGGGFTTASLRFAGTNSGISGVGGSRLDFILAGAQYGTLDVNGLNVYSPRIATAKYSFNVYGFTGPELRSGSGSPEGSVTADPGSIYLRSNGGAGTSFYVKESGTGNTGWVAK
jgi:hypothetical protein